MADPLCQQTADRRHQSLLDPSDNKFHTGNGDDGKHYWLTPPDLYAALDNEFSFDFDPCPYPVPEGFDGLTCEWGQSSYVNPPFGSIIHKGKKKGPTAWVRKAIAEQQKGKRVVLVYPVDKWILMLLEAGAEVRNLGDVRWLAIEDGSEGKGTGRHIACFVLNPREGMDFNGPLFREHEAACPQHDPDLVPDLLAVNEYLRAENAVLWGRIYAARTLLHAAEASGDWTAIEAAHKRLTGLEIEQWLQDRFGG